MCWDFGFWVVFEGVFGGVDFGLFLAYVGWFWVLIGNLSCVIEDFPMSFGDFGCFLGYLDFYAGFDVLVGFE